MTGKKHNKKLPEDGHSSGDIEFEYGFFSGHADDCGGMHITYRNPEQSDKTFSQTFNPSGSYTTTQHDSSDKEITTVLHPGEHRQYHGGGKSTHADGHFDVNVESTSRHEVAGDHAVATPRNSILGVGGNYHKITGSESHMKKKGSSAVTSRGYTGTVRESFKEDYFQHGEGNYAGMFEKSSLNIVKEDIAVQAGQNWDTYIGQKGKLETKQTFLIQTGQDATVNSAAKIVTKSSQNTEMSSQAEVKIDAQTKITLTVGSSSITIDSGSITIKSPSIKFEQG